MIYIYSKINSSKLLHIINRVSNIEDRKDISHPEQFLQVSTLKMQSGKIFKAHQHVWKSLYIEKIIAQESWIVFSGLVKINMYDIDGNFLQSEIIGPGDCSITFEGGHSYEVLENDTIVYEYKIGPYLGVDKDKFYYE